ncbi:MAG: hypothetical protein Q4C49_13460 [Bacillota bacterium]|nr:hypothetical protein [Bacillota bacterium]
MKNVERKQKIFYMLEMGLLLFVYVITMIIFKIKMDNIQNPDIALPCSEKSASLSYIAYYSIVLMCINLFFIVNKEYFFKYLRMYIFGLGLIVFSGFIFIKLFGFSYDIFNGIDSGIINFIFVSFVCVIYRLFLKR